MATKWKLPELYPGIDPQAAGEELDRIYHLRGEKLDPADVVEESRPVTAPLHGVFEWDDAVAAEKYREHQAADVIRSVVIVGEPVGDTAPRDVRAFVHAQQTYHPISVAVNTPGMAQELLSDAVRDIMAFKRKYEALTELIPVLRAMDEVLTARGIAS